MTNLDRYVIDFNGLTMNTTMATDKVYPPVMAEIKNLELNEKGRLRKREGIDDFSSGGNPSATRVNAIAPLLLASAGGSSNTVVAIADDEVWYTTTQSAAWSQIGAAVTSADIASPPYRIAWGKDVSDRPTVYFADRAPGVIKVETVTPARTVLGGATFTKAEAVEYYLGKLFVGWTTESGVVHTDRVRWSVTGDDTDWTGSGSGFLELNYPGSGDSTGRGISGMRVYRNRLFIASEVSLHVLTGSTGATFGSEFVRMQNYVNGATMYQTGGFLFYVDRDGIWQFDGYNARNIVRESMLARWNTLNDVNDIDQATASWDNRDGIYRVFFPAVQEQWDYYYSTGQWCIVTYASTDQVRVISPSNARGGTTSGQYMLGTVTNGKVFRYPQTKADDGNALSASFKSGHLRLGEMPRAGLPGDRFRLHYIDVEAARRDEAGVLKITLTVDGSSQTQATLVIADAGASAETFPTFYDGRVNARIDFGAIQLVGKTLQIEGLDDDADSAIDLRRLILYYERLAT